MLILLAAALKFYDIFDPILHPRNKELPSQEPIQECMNNNDNLPVGIVEKEEDVKIYR